MAQNSQYRGKMVKQNEVVYVAIPMNNADDDGVNNFHDEDIDGGKAPPAIYMLCPKLVSRPSSFRVQTRLDAPKRIPGLGNTQTRLNALKRV